MTAMTKEQAEAIIARLEALEAENAALKEQVEKRQRRDMTGFLTRNPDAGKPGKGPEGGMLPDVYGYCTIHGEDYRMAGWRKEEGRLSLQFTKQA